jgi:hypothetical protein
VLCYWLSASTMLLLLLKREPGLDFQSDPSLDGVPIDVKPTATTLTKSSQALSPTQKFENSLQAIARWIYDAILENVFVVCTMPVCIIASGWRMLRLSSLLLLWGGGSRSLTLCSFYFRSLCSLSLLIRNFVHCSCQRSSRWTRRFSMPDRRCPS